MLGVKLSGCDKEAEVGDCSEEPGVHNNTTKYICRMFQIFFECLKYFSNVSQKNQNYKICAKSLNFFNALSAGNIRAKQYCFTERQDDKGKASQFLKHMICPMCPLNQGAREYGKGGEKQGGAA